MKILVWNIKGGGNESQCWDIIHKHDPDICLLQEVNSINDTILGVYQIHEEYPTYKTLKFQKFKSVNLIKKGIEYSKPKYSFSNSSSEKIFNHFKGNLLGFSTDNFTFINVYSPPWEVPKTLFNWDEVSHLKLKKNPKLFITEILYDIVKSTTFPNKLIFGGDFNHSIKFDFGKGGNRGNQEIINRFHKLDYFDSLGDFNGGLIPTFQNLRGKEIKHQLDYLYIHKNQLENIQSCNLVNKRLIIGKKISDHLPILLELNV
jgi:exonuclease III